VSAVLTQESQYRAFGLRELLGREIQRVEDEDQLGRWFGRRPRGVKSADLWRPAVIEKYEIRRCKVRNRVPGRIGHDTIDGEEAFVHDGIGGARGRERPLRNGRILQRRGLPAGRIGTKNEKACKKGLAKRDGSIHHDSTCLSDSRRT
jgi:hypothetical protein